MVDAAAPLDEALKMVWAVASGGEHDLAQRKVAAQRLDGLPSEISDLPAPDSPAEEAARRAIMETIRSSCGATLAEALATQAKHSAEFMVSESCRKGRIGGEYSKTMLI